ncbi:MAG: PKD domain-containing protein [Saprospiraceae bacterium]|nr:PKD domain-containing protein [Saprospiraceae bacterium]
MKTTKYFASIIICVCLINFKLWSQTDCANYTTNPFPKCACDDCGLIEPNWELVSDSSNVCEGEVFQVSGALSAPLNLIEDYHWYFMDAITGDILYDVLMNDTSYVSFSYIVPNNVPCNQKTVSLDIDLVVTSPTCPTGESCRFKLSGVNVKLRPRASFAPVQEVCITDPVQFSNTTCNNGQTYLWNFGDGQTSTEENPDHIYAAPGVYTVTLIAYNGCGASQPFSRTVTVIGFPTATVDYDLNPTSGCVPVTIHFDNNSVNIDSFDTNDYQWTIDPTSGWFFNPDTVYSENSWNNVITFVSEGQYEVTLEVSNRCGDATWTELIDIYEAPRVQLQNMGNYCEVATIDFSDYVVFGGSIISYLWSVTAPNGTITTYTTASPTGTFNQPGNYTVTVTVGSLTCGNMSANASFFIESPGGTDFTGIPPQVCSSDDAFVLAALPPNGDWGISPNSPALNGNVFDPSLATPNITYTLTYDPPGNCVNQGSVTITVLEAATVNVEDGTIICIENGPYSLQYSPQGGSWTSNNGSVTLGGVFDPLIAGIGTDTLVYTFEDAIGCVITEDALITVEGMPSLVISDTITLCETDENISLPDNLAITTSPTTGVFNWTGPGIVSAASGLFNSSQIGGAGTYTVHVTYRLVDCQATDSVVLIVVPLTAALAGPDTLLCINEATYQLVGNPSGGTWSEANGQDDGLNTNTGLINLNQAGEGTFQYIYTLSEGTSCEASDTVSVEVIDLSDNVSAGNDFEVCEDEPAFTLSGNSPPNGTWTGPGILNGSTGLFDPSLVTPGTTVNLSYCIDNQNVNCPACDLVNVTVNGLPDALFSIIGTTCIGENLNIQHNATNACNYAWDFGDGSPIQNVQNPVYAYPVAGTYTIQFTATSCQGCRSVFSQQVTVSERATPQFAPSIAEGCAVLEVSFENQSQGSNMSFLWDFGNGQTSNLENPGTVAFEQGTTDTVYQVVLAVTNECGTVYFDEDITVFPQPITNFGFDVDDGCSPLAVEIRNITLGNPDTYAWFVNGALVSTDSALANQIFTTNDTMITVYDVLLVASNDCGIDSLTKQVTVYPPNVRAFISSDTTRGCQPLTVHFQNFATPGATVTWDFGDGNGSDQPNPTHVFETHGLFTVYQYASNCGTHTDSMLIEVLQAPSVSFTHEDYVCFGQPIHFVMTPKTLWAVAGILGTAILPPCFPLTTSLILLAILQYP